MEFSSIHRACVTLEVIDQFSSCKVPKLRKTQFMRQQTHVEEVICDLWITRSESDLSLQLWSNLSSWKESPETNLRLQQDLNPWPPRYRCYALPTGAWSLIGSRSRASSIYTRYMKRVRCAYDKNHIMIMDYCAVNDWYMIVDYCRSTLLQVWNLQFIFSTNNSQYQWQINYT